MEDGGDVLGNLPRTRPGRRSEKRVEQAKQSPPRRREPKPPEPESDPVGDAVRAAAGVAGAGLRVANGITREVIRRLPRP